jgi:probable phosphoglycerate mutase
MTTILLIRHGEVEGITPPRFRGREDLALTPKGVRQAEQVRDAISGRWVLNAVYCSPLSRCVRTADAIARPFNLDSVPHHGLIDTHYGAWQGLSVAEVAQRWPEELARWHTAPQTMRLPGGETLQEVQARATDALNAILHAHRHGVVAVVAHDSVNRVLLCHALGLPLGAYWTLSQSPCGISEVTFTDDRFTIHSLNETQHLGE